MKNAWMDMIRRLYRHTQEGQCPTAAIAIVATAFILSLPAQGHDAGPVFLKAFYPLDEPRFHCVDIPGHKHKVDVTRALGVHTCKEGIWHNDELFDPIALTDGHLRMPMYELCVGAVTADPDALLRLVSCQASPLNTWTYANFRLTLRAHPNMCLTIGPEASRLTPGGKRLASRHTARSLSLHDCDDTKFERQLWRFERPQTRRSPILPLAR